MQHRPWKTTKFQPTALIALVVVLLILFTLVGYFFMLPDLERAERAGQLVANVEEHRQRWKRDKPLAYRYVVERECYCPGEDTSPYIVIVARDVLTDAGVADPLLIDDLFQLAIDAASGSSDVQVSFDPRFGFPTRITIDDLAGNRASVEEYRVRDFEVTDYGRSGGSD